MFIKRIKLVNVRQFESIDVALTQDPSVPDSFLLFLGDNGTGKTSLLRAIALGLCDETSAASLVRELPGELVRYNSDGKGRIELTLVDADGVESRTSTVISVDPSSPSDDPVEYVEQKVRPPGANRTTAKSHEFPWHKLFIVAYGAGRGAEGTQEYYRYRHVDAVYTLFRYDQPLQSVELGLRRLRHAAKTGRRRVESVTARYLDMLSDILMLERDENAVPYKLVLEPSGLFYSAKDFRIHLSAQSDGFRATLAWVTDLIASYLLFDPTWNLETDSMRGIVLIDELEQHLHPSWQRAIVPRLRRHFPHVQFIIATHSPLVVLGTTALRPEDAEIVVLRRRLDTVEEFFQSDPPTKQRADQLLTSEYFGLFSASGFDVAADIQEYAKVSGKSRKTRADKEKLSALRERIEEALTPGDSALQREVRQAVRKVLKERASQALANISPSVLNFEIRRQLHTVLGIVD